MTRTIPHRWLREQAQVERLLEPTAFGDRFAPAEPVKCMVDQRRRLVRNREGDQVVSSTTLVFHPDTPAIPEGSRVTVAGRTSHVIVTATQRSLTQQHVYQEVNLQ